MFIANRQLPTANCKKDISRFAVVILGLIIFMPSLAYSGSLDALAPPGSATSAMFTIEDVFNRLGSSTTVTKRAGAFTEPSATPASTGHTLDDVMALVDIRARVMKTGQTTSFSGNDDGDLERGITWPNPRFTIDGAGTGTVVDNLTTLIWLRDANCVANIGDVNKTTTLNWADALTWTAALADGSCGLTDGSSAGDWRLSNVKELRSLIDFGFNSPALPNTAGAGQWIAGDPFNNVQSSDYWSSTTTVSNTSFACRVSLSSGFVSGVINFDKTGTIFVLPVRGGQ